MKKIAASLQKQKSRYGNKAATPYIVQITGTTPFIW
jgi:hypothetical protein